MCRAKAWWDRDGLIGREDSPMWGKVWWVSRDGPFGVVRIYWMIGIVDAKM